MFVEQDLSKKSLQTNQNKEFSVTSRKICKTKHRFFFKCYKMGLFVIWNCDFWNDFLKTLSTQFVSEKT